jgi:phosphoribosylformimino-5-aminoimidazole carboxamide ribotide isomerase
MLIIPAIDLKGGRCVRLTEGREESAKVYDRDPIEVVRGYEQAGARLIHIVDLDGAFLGARSENQNIIRRINSEVSIPIEVGGGIRSLADIESVLTDTGARYAIVGTMAVEQPDALAQAIKEFGDSIIVGIDARGDSEGPNIEMTRRVARASGVRVTASGGISSLEDLKQIAALESDGVDAVIVGKALYEGRFTLKAALAAIHTSR